MTMLGSDRNLYAYIHFKKTNPMHDDSRNLTRRSPCQPSVQCTPCWVTCIMQCTVSQQKTHDVLKCRHQKKKKQLSEEQTQRNSSMSSVDTSSYTRLLGFFPLPMCFLGFSCQYPLRFKNVWHALVKFQSWLRSVYPQLTFQFEHLRTKTLKRVLFCSSSFQLCKTTMTCWLWDWADDLPS